MIEAAPSAGLWPGQTDEAELGIGYELLDRLLILVVDEKLSDEEIREATGFEEPDILFGITPDEAFKLIMSAGVIQPGGAGKLAEAAKGRQKETVKA